MKNLTMMLNKDKNIYKTFCLFLVVCILFLPVCVFALQTTTLNKMKKTWDMDKIDYRRVVMLENANTLTGYTKYGHIAGSNKVANLGNKPKELCCSSFVAWTFYKSGIITDMKSNGKAAIDLNAEDITKSKYFTKVSASKALPGDVAYAPGVHIGIYLGENKNGVKMYIHCSANSGRNGVVTDHDSRFTEFYRYKDFIDDGSNSKKNFSDDGNGNFSSTTTNSNSSSSTDDSSNAKGSNNNDLTIEEYKNNVNNMSGAEISNCEGLLGSVEDPDSVAWLIQLLFNYLKILGPLIVIVLSSIDFAKCIVVSDDKSMEQAKKKLVIRLLLAALLFFVPTVTTVLLEVFGVTTNPLCGLN